MKRGLPILRRLYPSLRKRLAGMFWPGGYKIVASSDALFLVNYRNYVDRQIAFYGDYEPEQIAYLLGAMAERGCDLFLDIGANIGLYSIRVARAGLAGKLVAFEPDPRNLNQLGANLLMNGLTGRIEIVEKAVSERAGKVPFRFFPESSTGQSRVDEAGATDEVEAIRIDDHVALRDGVIFAKIDVEGHELAVIEGMKETMRRNRFFLQIESFPDRIGQLSAMLAEEGFRELHHIDDDYFFANFP